MNVPVVIIASILSAWILLLFLAMILTILGNKKSRSMNDDLFFDSEVWKKDAANFIHQQGLSNVMETKSGDFIPTRKVLCDFNTWRLEHLKNS